MTDKCPMCGATARHITIGNKGGLLEVYCEAGCGWEESGVARDARLRRQLAEANAQNKNFVKLLSDALAHTPASYREPCLDVLRKKGKK